MIEIIKLEVFTKQTLLNFLRNLYTQSKKIYSYYIHQLSRRKGWAKKIAPHYQNWLGLWDNYLNWGNYQGPDFCKNNYCPYWMYVCKKKFGQIPALYQVFDRFWPFLYNLLRSLYHKRQLQKFRCYLIPCSKEWRHRGP